MAVPARRAQLCPECVEPVPDEALPCPACGRRYHDGCRDAAGRCVIPGCDGAPAARGSSGEPSVARTLAAAASAQLAVERFDAALRVTDRAAVRYKLSVPPPAPPHPDITRRRRLAWWWLTSTFQLVGLAAVLNVTPGLTNWPAPGFRSSAIAFAMLGAWIGGVMVLHHVLSPARDDRFRWLWLAVRTAVTFCVSPLCAACVLFCLIQLLSCAHGPG